MLEILFFWAWFTLAFTYNIKSSKWLCHLCFLKSGYSVDKGIWTIYLHRKCLCRGGWVFTSSLFFCICIFLSYSLSFPVFASGLHDLLAPDLTIANEWWVLHYWQNRDFILFPPVSVIVALNKNVTIMLFFFFLLVCARRTYCETDIDPAHRKLSQLQAVVGYLTGKEPDLDCELTV